MSSKRHHSKRPKEATLDQLITRGVFGGVLHAESAVFTRRGTTVCGDVGTITLDMTAVSCPVCFKKTRGRLVNVIPGLGERIIRMFPLAALDLEPKSKVETNDASNP